MPAGDDALAEAQATIERQRAEVERLAATRMVSTRLSSLFLVDEQRQQLGLDVAHGATVPAVRGRFAMLAATALEQSRSHQVFVELIDDVLRARAVRERQA